MQYPLHIWVQPPFGDTCHTVCDSCGKQFRVMGDGDKRAVKVMEEPTPQPQLTGIR